MTPMADLRVASANLHNELLERLDPSASALEADLYASAYRVLREEAETTLQVWQEALALGRPLPTMPLWMRGGLCLPIELEDAYQRTCHEYRIAANGG